MALPLAFSQSYDTLACCSSHAIHLVTHTSATCLSKWMRFVHSFLFDVGVARFLINLLLHGLFITSDRLRKRRGTSWNDIDGPFLRRNLQL